MALLDPELQEGAPPQTAVAAPPMQKRWLSPLNERRWANFKKNKRALWSLWIFSVLFGLSLFAEFLAYDKPILVRYQGELYTPIWSFYPETAFGGDFRTEADYSAPEVDCLIRSGGLEDCFDDPEGIVAGIKDGTFGEGVDGFHKGWMIWPMIPYSFDTAVERPGAAPLPPNEQNWLGTDGTKRDVMARIIHGFRLSVMFTLLVTGLSAVIGVIAGALQGYFGGRLDLFFQRFIEVWSSTPQLYVIILTFAMVGRSFSLLVFLMVIFGWMGIAGLVRAEFLRARNLEYVRAARALGVGNLTIMFRHMLPNAMVATLTFLPFIITGTIGGLAQLDYIGFGLPGSAPSLGELTLQAKQNLEAPWLAFSAFVTFAVMLSLLIFIFEGIRDAFDPRKTFS